MTPVALALALHLSYFLILAGTYLVGRDIRFGWLLRMTGDIGFVMAGWHLGLTPIVCWSILFVLIDISGYAAFESYTREDE